MERNKVKDEENLLERLQSEVAMYADDADDQDFEILVRITCEDGWVSCDLVKN